MASQEVITIEIEFQAKNKASLQVRMIVTIVMHDFNLSHHVRAYCNKIHNRLDINGHTFFLSFLNPYQVLMYKHH